MEEFEALIALLRGDGAPVAMFVLFVVGLMREWWVMGTSYRAACAERDRAIAAERAWRDAALRERQIAERAVDVAARSG